MWQAAERCINAVPVNIARLHKGGHIPSRKQVGEHLVEFLLPREMQVSARKSELSRIYITA